MLREKKIAVLGLARAGAPAALFLAGRGAQVVGYDAKSRSELGDTATILGAAGIELRLGGIGYPGLDECSLIVLSPGLKVHHQPLRGILARCAANGAEIIGELELAARHCPAPMIAVTGTKGKSTTTKLIAELLTAVGIDAVRAGNTGVPLVAELSSLSPRSWAVVEVSSFQLETVTTLKPRIAALLNLLPDHQDYHTSLTQYWDTKLKLFALQGDGDTAIFNADDANIAKWRAAELKLQPAFSQLRAHVSLVSGAEKESGSSLAVARRGGALGLLRSSDFEPMIDVADVPLRGEHNLGNVAVALAAVNCVLASRDIAPSSVKLQLREAVNKFESLPHRLEKVGTVRGITFINDSQATIPDAAIKALEAFEPPVTLIAGGLNKLENADAFAELGRAVASRAHLLVVIGNAAQAIAEAARGAGFPDSKIVMAGDLTNAVTAATIGTPQGGFVVLSPACASFDQFKSFEDRGACFRAAVAALGETS